MERLRSQLLVENRYPQPAAPGQKKGRQPERLHNSERAAKGARIIQSLLLRRKDRWTKTSLNTQPSRLGTFRSFMCSIPLAGKTEPRPCTVIGSLPLPLFPTSQHVFINLLPCHHNRQDGGWPHLQQLEGHSKHTPPCVLSPLALAVEADTAARKQEKSSFLLVGAGARCMQPPPSLQGLGSSRQYSFRTVDGTAYTKL